jgi:hypothetical protein
MRKLNACYRARSWHNYRKQTIAICWYFSDETIFFASVQGDLGANATPAGFLPP